MTLKTRLSVLLISTPVLAFVLVGGLMGKEPPGDEKFQHLRVFDDVMDLVRDKYVEPVKVDRVMEGAMRGLADGLDADSAYLTEKEVRSVESGETAPAGEIGLELTRQYWLRVVAARDGSPAAKAGLQTGDYIRAIDGKPTRDISVFQGMRLLRGQPGSKVTLTVIRGNAADPQQVVLAREVSSSPLVSGKLLDPETGYIRIASFQRGAPDELRKQSTELIKSGAKNLVIDVRRVAEGALENGVAAARLFVKSGTLAIKSGRDTATARESLTTRNGDGSIDVPITVLVSTGTAGAAEVFVAALQDNKRAELIGERTLGRAGVQKLVKLPENRGLWLTYTRYLTPAGKPIQGHGVEPSVSVEEPDVEFGAPPPAHDVILDTALDRLRKKRAA